MHNRERHILAVCSVVFAFMATPVLADVSGAPEEPFNGPNVFLPTKAERPGKSPRRAARVLSEQDRAQAFGALASAPEVQNRTRRVQLRDQAAPAASAWSLTSSPLIAEARRYMGTNPTNRRSLWCGAFMNLVLERTGHQRGSSDLAKSFASYGTRVSGPQVGAIAVMSRGPTGGHVGVVTGIDPSGNPIIISGNHENRVAEVPYPRGRIFAYVMPGAPGSAALGIKQASADTANSTTRDN